MICTNLSVKQWKAEWKTTITDHKVYVVELTLHKSTTDVDSRYPSMRINNKDMRKEATSERVIEEIIKMEDSIAQPLKKLYLHRVAPRKAWNQWYSKQPKSMQNIGGNRQNFNSKEEVYLRNDFDWGERIRQLSLLLEENRLKEFHKLLDGMTKLRVQNPIVRGIIRENEETILH